jgi:NADH-quinone oxidoreductase subunit H
MAGWFDRKLTARLQWRVGPPWYQNFVDLVKLLGKEIIVPYQAKWTFLLAPYIGLFGVILSATMLGMAIFFPAKSFTGDLIVILYLLVLPALSLIIGASSSRNPLASVGASREMKLILSYELPFILAILAVIIKAQGIIRLGSLVAAQAQTGSFVFSFSGAIACAVAVLCMQAKLGITPFEVSEAEQEIMGGTLIEYSGLPLAVFKLTKAMLLYTMPLFLIILFFGRDVSPLWITVKLLALWLVIVLIKNTNPRLRIDHIMRFFWGPVTVLAFISVILAIRGL